MRAPERRRRRARGPPRHPRTSQTACRLRAGAPDPPTDSPAPSMSTTRSGPTATSGHPPSRRQTPRPRTTKSPLRRPSRPSPRPGTVTRSGVAGIAGSFRRFALTPRAANVRVKQHESAFLPLHRWALSQEESMPVLAPDSDFSARTLAVRPWPDAVIDAVGHDPRSFYVERFWLAVLGPSAVWFLRRLAAELEANPAGFDLDFEATARALGIGMRSGRHSPFSRTVSRCCQFGITRVDEGEGVLLFRRKLPPLTRHQVTRLPTELQAAHGAWLDEQRAGAAGEQRNRARRHLPPRPEPRVVVPPSAAHRGRSITTTSGGVELGPEEGYRVGEALHHDRA